ncbi:MAG: PEPxxWA-CTERM sorting domain-containing protein [Phenylobacterium sp.]|nr:PEPxxWA-CTERM sorting domain-containing protein [Phenylobacterium sp.]
MDDLTFTTGLSSAVPEPATWAMMIVGFGAAGSMVRSARRRRGAIYAA